MNTRVGHIAWRQTHFGGFVASPSPSLEAFEDKDDDGDSSDGDVDEDEDEDASSSSDEEPTAFQWLALCHSWQKWGVVMYLEEKLV